ncbi:NAD(P)-binding protein [Thelephora ganbajun]|uniref:NAD(P)-binding protein n=1 Tax=Thelephora ganbajun TaxID=370292 RepID=A0ACB6Z1J0_THEGA|nr:NAD(P)-binding protein [Thelephora ganbajun]
MASSVNRLPTKRRVWRIVGKGSPSEALVLDNRAPLPKLKRGEVLVKVQAVSLNPVGWKLMKSFPNSWFKREAEMEFAGEIVEVNHVEDFKPTDQVFGFLPPIPVHAFRKKGVLAQYAAIPSQYLAHRLESLTPQQASGISLVGLTAYQAVYELVDLRPGQTVFVNGGTTAVGIYAIQMAKALGCRVIATASGKNEEFLRALGIDEFIDYTKSPLVETLISNSNAPKVDVFLEAVGFTTTDLYKASEKFLAPGGTFLSVGPTASTPGGSILGYFWTTQFRPTWLGGVKSRFRMVSVDFTRKNADILSNLIKDGKDNAATTSFLVLNLPFIGKVKPVIDSVFSFDDALRAYDRILTARAVGKVVIEVPDDSR